MAWDPRVLAALKSRAEAEGLPLEMFAQPKAVPGYGVDQLKAAQEEDVGAARQADSHATLASIVNGLASRRAAQYPTTRAPVMDENVKRYLMQRQMAAAEQGPAPADVLGAIQGAAKDQAAIGETRAKTGEIAARTPGVAADASVKQGLAGAVSPATSQIAAGYKMQFPPGTTEEIARRALDDRAKQEGQAIDWSKVGIERDRLAQDQGGKGKDIEGKLRGERAADPVIKATKEVNQAFAKMRSAPGTGTGDLSLIYAYVKLLDPGSVVREGEIALSRSPTPLLDKLTQQYKQAAAGNLLHPNLRRDYLEAATRLHEAQQKEAKVVDDNYRGLAQRYGVDAANVVLPLVGEEAPGAGSGSSAADTALRKKYGLE